MAPMASHAFASNFDFARLGGWLISPVARLISWSMRMPELPTSLARRKFRAEIFLPFKAKDNTLQTLTTY